MEQLVLLLVIAAISLVNWLIEKSGKLREQRRLEKARADREETPSRTVEAREEPTLQQPPEEPERQLRRMLESFGFPVQEEEPAAEPPPVITRQPPSLPPAPPATPTPRPRRRRETAAASIAPAIRHPLLRDLRSRDGLRRAVVLREILGPPKALAAHQSGLS
jgi:hypothetical protein